MSRVARIVVPGFAHHITQRGSSTIESYTYDAQGRRTSGNGLAYTYNDDDQLLAMGGAVAYDYSDNGYRRYRYTSTTAIGYDYTTAGQLVGVRQYVDDNGTWVLEQNADEITYQLDAAGRRVAKLVDNVVEEKYLWAGHNMTLLAVYDESDALTARFEYGVGRMPVRMTQNSNTYYFAYDQVGSLRAVFDDKGALVHEITYDSYGNILSETASGLCVPFGFAGGLHDRDTGIVLFGFRDYDPETGTWLTPDPIGFAGGDVYLYGYCGSDPVNYVDPSGLLAWYDRALNCTTDFTAGFGDAWSFGLAAPVSRLLFGEDVYDYVDSDSRSNTFGEVGGMASTLFLGGGRVAYAGLNRLRSIRYLRLAAQQPAYAARMLVARASCNSRIGLKKVFNFGLPGKLKYTWNNILHNYLLDPAAIIRASGRTNGYWNSLGAGMIGAGIKEGYDQIKSYFPVVVPDEDGVIGSSGGKIKM